MTQGLTTDQKRLFAYVVALVGATPTYVNLYYQGLIAGSEFLTYNAKKLYIAFEFKASNEGVQQGFHAMISFYDPANAVNFHINDNSLCALAGPAFYYAHNYSSVNNIFFSRIVAQLYTEIVFNGIKVTWP